MRSMRDEDQAYLHSQGLRTLPAGTLHLELYLQDINLLQQLHRGCGQSKHDSVTSARSYEHRCHFGSNGILCYLPHKVVIVSITGSRLKSIITRHAIWDYLFSFCVVVNLS